jgi:HSP20 family protein
MSLIRWNPVREMNLLTRNFDDLFSTFNDRFGVGNTGAALMPRVDISEDQDHLYIMAELPGMKENDVQVTCSEGVLTIRGEKKQSEEHKERNFYRLERSYGTFTRQFALPENVKEEEIQATFDDGVLEIKIAKAEETKPVERQVQITSKRSQSNERTQLSDSSHVDDSGKLGSTERKEEAVSGS